MRRQNFYLIILLAAILNVFACLAYADDLKIPEWMPKVLGMQYNEIYQNMPDFHSPYEGPNSLTTDNNKDHGSSQIYGLYLGSQITSSLQVYLDIEMAQGNGISNAVGLGDYTNGDVIRQGSADLGNSPYIARLYGRYVFPLFPNLPFAIKERMH
ncbi:MAG: hypothetical protein WAU61_10530 [Smithella sp.]